VILSFTEVLSGECSFDLVLGFEVGDDKREGNMRIFLSHNKADKEVARALGAYLVLAGADVWFDDWEIRAGDSIPGKLNEGLADFDVFLLLWSANAARSNWVRRELEAALHQVIQTRNARVIPCLLDDTPLPPILRDIRGEEFDDPKQAMSRLVDELFRFRTRKERLLAIQDVLMDMDLTWSTSPGTGTFICCPKCGAEDTLEGWQQTDFERDDVYAGLRCRACGWEDGGEI
jgi:hypothetical protein